jgi:hypothetical protein
MKKKQEITKGASKEERDFRDGINDPKRLSLVPFLTQRQSFSKRNTHDILEAK